MSQIQLDSYSVELTNLRPAKEIDGYLVTAKEMIISLVSHKEMKWDDKSWIKKSFT